MLTGGDFSRFAPGRNVVSAAPGQPSVPAGMASESPPRGRSPFAEYLGPVRAKLFFGDQSGLFRRLELVEPSRRDPQQPPLHWSGRRRQLSRPGHRCPKRSLTRRATAARPKNTGLLPAFSHGPAERRPVAKRSEGVLFPTPIVPVGFIRRGPILARASARVVLHATISAVSDFSDATRFSSFCSHERSKELEPDSIGGRIPVAPRPRLANADDGQPSSDGCPLGIDVMDAIIAEWSTSQPEHLGSGKGGTRRVQLHTAAACGPIIRGSRFPVSSVPENRISQWMT